MRQAAQGLALAKPGQFRTALVRAGMKVEAYDALAESVEMLLADEQLTGTEIRHAVGVERLARDLPKGTFVFFLRGLSHAGRILRVGVRGGPRSQTFEYRRTQEWLGEPLRIPDEPEALTELLPGYLKAHGPASVRDIAWWASVQQKVAKEALRRCAHREARLEGRKDVLYASESLPEGQARLPSKMGLNLLPHWDPYLTAHVDRSRYLTRRWHDWVIDQGGNSTDVILRDGQVVGVWDDSEGVLAYAAFESSPGAAAVGAASRRLVGVLGDLEPVKRASPSSLHEGGQNAFRSPLRGVPPSRPGD